MNLKVELSKSKCACKNSHQYLPQISKYTK